jgi:FKBP-type peptidyl-prolyl cis-trans isomerase
MPFPFTAGSKTGLIPGFLETLNAMSIGDKAVAFIPAKLGYGERGAGDVIPPNTNLIFEIELLDAMPKAAPKK